MNLLRETLADIARSGHLPQDIVFIGSEVSGHQCSWEEFQRLADVEYDAGFGAQKVASDLIIVFGDGQKMWRQEYDGSEQWGVTRPFQLPTETRPITRLTVEGTDRVGWVSLAELAVS